MKNRLLFFIACQLIFIASSFCQGNGVYVTNTDFEQGKITSLMDCDIIENWDGSISLSAKGGATTYKFGTVFGYIKNGVKYRKYGSKRKFFTTYGYCQLLDESGLMIYSKPSRHHRSNGYVWHYYSLKPTSEIRPLTLKNLRRDFPDNPEFTDLMKRSMKRKDYLRESNGRLMVNEIYLRKVADK
jgi:hypothetical protein